MTKPEMIEFLTTNCECWKGDKNKAVLNGMDEADVKKQYVANRAAQAGFNGFTDETTGKTYTFNAEKETYEVAEADEVVVDTPANATLNAEDQAALDYGKRRMNADKLALVTKITANVADPKKREEIGRKLMTNSIEDLEERLAMLPPAQQVVNKGAPPSPLFPAYGPLFPAAPDKPVANSLQDDVLPPPTINWNEKV